MTECRLWIERLGFGNYDDVVKLLNDFEDAYNSIYVFNSIVKTFVKAYDAADGDREKYNSDFKSYFIPMDKIASEVKRDDKLECCPLKSKGIWELRGSLYPLELMQRWIMDHYERPSEEAEKLWVEIKKHQVDFFKTTGVPVKEIQEALDQYIYNPLNHLRNHQVNGIIGDARLI